MATCMKRANAKVLSLILVASGACKAVSAAGETQYTLPTEIHWLEVKGQGVPRGSFYAYLRGKESDKCGQVFRIRFPDRYVYPWHVNNRYGVYTVLQGTLVIGFDKHHLASAERTLPAGSVLQGLTTEPHYGRAIGETIFEAYMPCDVR